MEVFATGWAWPTEAVPVTVTGPAGKTAPSAGVLMVVAIPVPPGRLPSTAEAGGAVVITRAMVARVAVAVVLSVICLPHWW